MKKQICLIFPCSRLQLKAQYKLGEAISMANINDEDNKPNGTTL